MSNNLSLLPLDAASLPLYGRHLIEASAGTGKTFNITRIYLRLLLERDLKVEQLLVMTFTKAATEELRGRIDSELRRALAEWPQLVASDEFYRQLAQRVDGETARQRLAEALLYLDDAAIYTIHGFCSRALSQQAFASGLPLELELKDDASPLLWQAIRDWLRQLAADEPAFALLQQAGWHSPESFHQQFRRALTSITPVVAPSLDEIDRQAEAERQRWLDEQINPRKQAVLAGLQQAQAELLAALVDNHKERAKRLDEWQQLLGWLQQQDLQLPPKAAGEFINGNRYRGNEQIKNLLEPFKQLRTEFTKALEAQDKALTQQRDGAPLAALVCAGIQQIRGRFAAAKAQAAQLDFDDLIQLLAARLASTEGAALLAALRQAYPAALVDEFQDTDPAQYAIFDALYPQGDGSRLLLMIGDPKQAIYAFRGGDIFTYLAARAAADHHWQMDTNWRSLPAVVGGYNRLFWGAPLTASPAELFGYGIGYQPVKAADTAKALSAPLHDPLAERAALNYLWLGEQEGEEESGSGRPANKADQQQQLAHWCACEIRRLLASARLGDEPLRERDIAVLVRSGHEASVVREALRQLGYPSVYLSERDNLFASSEAAELLRLLDGLLALDSDRLLLAALSTRLLGGDAALLAQLADPNADELWQQQRERLLSLRQLWQQRGPMALLLHLLYHHYQPAPASHERSLTNMIHLAEQLQQAAGQQPHPQQLRQWLQQQIDAAQAGQGEGGETAQLRLESDANLIRVVTLHGSKGLEYPLVFIPFASNYRDPVKVGNQFIHYFEYQHSASNSRRQQVGASEEALRECRAQGEAESLRLLYVAVTRAIHRCYLGVAPTKGSHRSALGLALKLDSEASWTEALNQLVASSNGDALLLNGQQLPAVVAHKADTQPLPPLALAQLPRAIDSRWALHSFSALVRDSRSAQPADRDAEQSSATPPPEPSAGNQLALRFALRRGSDAGILLHSLFEQLDFTAPNWPRLLEPLLRRSPLLSPEQQPALSDWLNDCLHSPLPPLHADDAPVTLAQLAPGRTLRECGFHFTLSQASLAQLARLLARERGEARLWLPGPPQLEGMMHGFIDLIFEWQGRFYLADYKSSHLGNGFADYQPAALARHVAANYYDLQYLIYALALHRYLASRLPGYDPARHFGGVYYLYLRGMSAAEPGAGIYAKALASPLLDELDQLMGGRP